MYRILIIEDDPDIRAELKLLLENALYHVDAVSDFARTIPQIQKANPDLILMDIQLPGISGLALCQEIRRTMEVPIIFVTALANPMDELSGMMMGGDDYITKPYHAPLLLARIAAVLKRTGHQTLQEDPYLFTWKGCELNLLDGTIRHGEMSTELTKNELRICYNLFSRAGQIVSREDLIDDLWDNQIFIDDNTLSVHITRIRGKLKEIGMGGLIQTRRGQGYLI